MSKIAMIVKNIEKADDYFMEAYKIGKLLSANHIEQLQHLMLGPIFDGDIISKSKRDDLIDWGLAVRCCYKKQQGYTVARPLAYTVLKEIGELK